MDAILVIAGLVASLFLRPILFFGKPIHEPIWWPTPLWILIPILWCAALVLTRNYDLRTQVHFRYSAGNLITGSCLASLLMSGLLFFSYRGMSRLQVLSFCFLTTILLLINRWLVRTLLKGGRLSPASPRKVMIVGTAPLAIQLSQTIRDLSWMGFEFSGFVDDAPQPGSQVLGSTADIVALTNQHHIDEILITKIPSSQEELRNLVQQLHEKTSVNVRMVPDVFPLVFLRMTVDDFGGVPLVTLREPILTPFERITKRIFDVLICSLLIPLLLPLMMIIAIAVRIASGAPILFVHERVGENGRLFPMLKFRTMLPGSDGKVVETEKSKTDPRVTPIGAFLRRTSLDELPQLFNVWKGDMSLVGPRPEMPWLVDRYEPWQRKRFSVPQGLTGWWQVNGRGDKPMHLNTEEDLFYIRNYSLWLDLTILWKTLKMVVLGKGAF